MKVRELKEELSDYAGNEEEILTGNIIVIDEHEQLASEHEKIINHIKYSLHNVVTTKRRAAEVISQFERESGQIMKEEGVNQLHVVRCADDEYKIYFNGVCVWEVLLCPLAVNLAPFRGID